MNKAKQWINSIRTFFSDVNVELKKCAWPTRSELIQSTIVVIVSVFLVGIYVSASDMILMHVLRFIIR